tara:strand:- start:16814 stop:17071 length:258 start_codon:yes stop_codon:yes gene_type:complete
MNYAMVSRINAFGRGQVWVYVDLHTHRIALPYVFETQKQAVDTMGSPVVEYNPDYWNRLNIYELAPNPVTTPPMSESDISQKGAK